MSNLSPDVENLPVGESLSYVFRNVKNTQGETVTSILDSWKLIVCVKKKYSDTAAIILANSTDNPSRFAYLDSSTESVLQAHLITREESEALEPDIYYVGEIWAESEENLSRVLLKTVSIKTQNSLPFSPEPS